MSFIVYPEMFYNLLLMGIGVVYLLMELLFVCYLEDITR